MLSLSRSVFDRKFRIKAAQSCHSDRYCSGKRSLCSGKLERTQGGRLAVKPPPQLPCAHTALLALLQFSDPMPVFSGPSAWFPHQAGRVNSLRQIDGRSGTMRSVTPALLPGATLPSEDRAMPFGAANRSPALTVLDGLVEFFADGSRWRIGWFSGHDDSKWLEGRPGWSGLGPAFG